MKQYGHGDLAASLVLIFPRPARYEIGVLFTGAVNGADVVTRAIYATLGSRTAYLLVHAVIALVFLLWIRRGSRWSDAAPRGRAARVLEAAIYALTLGASSRWSSTTCSASASDPSSVISALGAGVHEELVFRLGADRRPVSHPRHVAARAAPVALAIVVVAAVRRRRTTSGRTASR